MSIQRTRRQVFIFKGYLNHNNSLNVHNLRTRRFRRLAMGDTLVTFKTNRDSFWNPLYCPVSTVSMK